MPDLPSKTSQLQLQFQLQFQLQLQFQFSLPNPLEGMGREKAGIPAGSGNGDGMDSLRMRISVNEPRLERHERLNEPTPALSQTSLTEKREKAALTA